MQTTNLPSHPDLNISAFEQMLELKSLTNSYKLYWFAAIFDEIIHGKKEIPFQDIVTGMICKCWYSILTYKLNFGKMDQLGKMVQDIYDVYGFDKTMPENDLKKEISRLLKNKNERLKNDILISRISEFYKYVPYRMLSVFFRDELKSEKISDNQKHSEIIKLSQQENRSLYKIDIENRKIMIHPLWYEYIRINNPVVKGWMYHKLIYFLQVRNPSVPAIPFKLYPPGKRNLTGAKSFFNQILKIQNQYDIYTDELLAENTFSIDHFIPWSFVMHDRLWNLVPTTVSVNSMKSDSLPELDRYFDRFCRFQYSGYAIAMNNNINKKLMEDYLDVSEDRNILKTVLPEPEFTTLLKKRIQPLCQIAENSGFRTGFIYEEDTENISKVAEPSGEYSP